MDFLGSMLRGTGYVMDPLNLTGINTQPVGPGSQITGNVAGTAHDPKSDAMGRHLGDPGFTGSIDGTIQPPNAAAQRYLSAPGVPGFMSSMMDNPHKLPPPPPAAWAYEPGKGPVWQTPERTINAAGKTPTEMNWKMTDSSSPWTGNRI